MNIVDEFPPNIADILKVFTPTATTVFTYGQTLYNPNKCPVDMPIMAHEITHAQQQGDDPAGWWATYLADRAFRLEMETEAYQVQYRMARKILEGRDEQALYLQKLAQTLSGELYGGLITLTEAKKLILWNPKTQKKKRKS